MLAFCSEDALFLKQPLHFCFFMDDACGWIDRVDHQSCGLNTFGRISSHTFLVHLNTVTDRRLYARQAAEAAEATEPDCPLPHRLVTRQART